MMQCSKIDDYLDLKLNKKERCEFEVHAQSCDTCRPQTEKWKAIGSQIIEIGHGIKQRQPKSTPGDVQRLVSKAEKSTISNWYPIPVLGATFCIIALVIIGYTYIPKSQVVTTALRNTPLTINATQVSLVDGSFIPFPIETRAVLQTADTDRLLFHVGSDLMGLSSNAEAMIETATFSNTTFRLHNGTIACAVVPRSPNRKFSVVVEKEKVEVVGTRFYVTAKDNKITEIAVLEGKIKYTNSLNKKQFISAGKKSTSGPKDNHQLHRASETEQRLLESLLRRNTVSSLRPSTPASFQSIDLQKCEQLTLNDRESETPSTAKKSTHNKASIPIQKVESPPLSTLQQWVLDGRIDEAMEYLNKYIKSHPKSGTGWFLMGDCYSRKKQYGRALKTYETFIANNPSSSVTNTARYKAGVVSQDKLRQHRKAILLFNEFLKNNRGSKHLEPEAKLRLAKSHMQLGQHQKAKALLQIIARDYPTQPVGKSAVKILKDTYSNDSAH